MTRFSANLGFLWTEIGLPDAIRAAAAAGFDAVECHWPYDVPAVAVRAALQETGLSMLGLNTVRGQTSRGENGLTAVPGRETEARAAIDQALAYAQEVGAKAVHVMAGYAEGPQAEQTFLDGLDYACRSAEASDCVILIEPLNRHDAPGYFLQTTDQAAALIAAVGAPNLKLMFDCYHVGRTEGDLTTRLEALMPIIGHVQIASVPDRGPPYSGEIYYPYLFDLMDTLGWDRPIGAEYKPTGRTEDSLGWIERARAT